MLIMLSLSRPEDLLVYYMKASIASLLNFDSKAVSKSRSDQVSYFYTPYFSGYYLKIDVKFCLITIHKYLLWHFPINYSIKMLSLPSKLQRAKSIPFWYIAFNRVIGSSSASVSAITVNFLFLMFYSVTK